MQRIGNQRVGNEMEGFLHMFSAVLMLPELEFEGSFHDLDLQLEFSTSIIIIIK